MRFFFLFMFMLHVAAKITLFDEHTSLASVPTFDFFEHRPDAYNVTGIPCRISLARDPETQQCDIMALPTLNKNSFTQGFQETIVFVTFSDAYNCGIRTISQLFKIVHVIQPFLSKSGYPPSKTLVVFMGAPYSDPAGCPIREPYRSRKLSIPDSVPPSDMNVALVGGEHAMQILKAYDDTKPYAFNVAQETDSWNAMFSSFGYLFFKWWNVAIYSLSVVVALKPIFETNKKSAIVVDFQNIIFCIAVSAALGSFFYADF